MEDSQSAWIVPVIIVASAVAIAVVIIKKIRSSRASEIDYDALVTGATESRINWKFEFPERDAYDEVNANAGEDRKALASALMRRAMAVVEKIFIIQREHSGMVSGYQKGAVLPHVWREYQICQNEVNAEVLEIQQEAEQLKEGWGKQVVEQAAQMVNNELQKKAYQEHMKRMEKERAKQAKKQQLEQQQKQAQEERDKQEEQKRKERELRERAAQSEKIAKQLMEEENKKKKTKNK